MPNMKITVFILSTIVIGRRSTCALVDPITFGNQQKKILTSPTLAMVGGRGWDNSDYLSSLSGDDEDRNKSQEEYKDFSERRAAFHARQAEIMKTPEAQAFLKQRQEQQFQQLQEEQNGEAFLSEEEMLFGSVTESSGGGTRMGHMMARAKRMQGGQTNRIGGFQQQLLFPLEEDNDDSSSGVEEL